MAVESVVNQLHPEEPRWFAVHTRARSEKFVQRLLAKKGIHAWVPFQKLLRRYVRSKRWVEKPLINGYVFVRIVEADYRPVLETAGVAGFLKFAKNLIAIPENELEVIRRITMEGDLEVEMVQGAFAAGDAVEIRAGNLSGLRGHVVKVEGKRKLQVELSHVGCSLLLSVDTVFLEKTKPSG